MPADNREVFQLSRLYSSLLHGELDTIGTYYVEFEGLPESVKPEMEEDDARSILRTVYTPNGDRATGMHQSNPVKVEVYQRGEIGPATDFKSEVGEPIVRLSDINQPLEGETEEVFERVELWKAAREGQFTPIEIYDEELDAILESEGAEAQVTSEEPLVFNYPNTEVPEDVDHMLFDYSPALDGSDEAFQVYSNLENGGQYQTVTVGEDWMQNLEPSLDRQIDSEFNTSLPYKVKSRVG